ncbi:hypothetical protein QE152_g9006 [Popillia japonica]|uniref:Gag-pol polyprotein n=1 Tax=Popillia japonica TaxID=7064 RepID=A0AAW1LWB4_POPJA
MLGTRPDLSYSINFFSRYQNCASDNHYNYLSRLLRYLKTTLNFELTYSNNVTSVPLVGYADADWGNESDRRSVTGYLFKIYDNTVSWVSRKQPTVSLSSTEAEYVSLCSATTKQPTVSLSSTEAEYVSLCSATTEAIWLKRLLHDLGIETGIVNIYEDNMPCIAISKDPVYHKKVKHIDIKYHFIREQIKNKIIEPIYISTQEQIADVLTKGLSSQKFTVFRDKLGVRSYEYFD